MERLKSIGHILLGTFSNLEDVVWLVSLAEKQQLQSCGCAEFAFSSRGHQTVAAVCEIDGCIGTMVNESLTRQREVERLDVVFSRKISATAGA
jgi:hypothetical protein